MGTSRSLFAAALAAGIVGASPQASADEPSLAPAFGEVPSNCFVGHGVQLGDWCFRPWAVIEFAGVHGSRIYHGAQPSNAFVYNLNYTYTSVLLFYDLGYRAGDGTNITIRQSVDNDVPSLEFIRIERPNGNEWTFRSAYDRRGGLPGLTLELPRESGALEFGVYRGPLALPNVWADAQTRIGTFGVGLFAQAGVDDFGAGPQFAPELDLRLSFHRNLEFEIAAHYDRVGIAGAPANAFGLDYQIYTRLGQHGITIGGTFAHGSTQWMRAPGYSYSNGVGDFNYWQAFTALQLRWSTFHVTELELIYSRGPLTADDTIDFVLDHYFAPTGGANCHWCQTRLGASVWYEHAFTAPGNPIRALGASLRLTVPVN